MLQKENSLLFIIDVQQKLVNALEADNITLAAEKTTKIAKAAKILNIETILTEQYPKGLGATIEPVKQALGDKYAPFEKTSFSAIKEENIYNAVVKSGKKQIVILGIEAHICVFQTACQLAEYGYEVFVAEDITFSRKEFEKQIAMKNLHNMKIQTPSLETILFMWLESSKNPDFKAIQSLIK